MTPDEREAIDRMLNRLQSVMIMVLGSIVMTAAGLLIQHSIDVRQLNRMEKHLEIIDGRDERSINDRKDIRNTMGYLEAVVKEAIAKDRERQKAREAQKK